MAQNEYIHVSPKVRAKDHTTLATVRSLPGYSSRDPEFELPKLEAADAALVAANKDFAKLNAAWGPARDKLVAAKWAFHNAIGGRARPGGGPVRREQQGGAGGGLEAQVGAETPRPQARLQAETEDAAERGLSRSVHGLGVGQSQPDPPPPGRACLRRVGENTPDLACVAGAQDVRNGALCNASLTTMVWLAEIAGSVGPWARFSSA